jgi:C-terminal processing protease CtpA/Prc
VAVGADGNLGTEVLRRFRVTFDYGRRVMRLQPTASAGQPFLFPTSGMQVEPWIAEDGSIGIDDVHENSPATRAGLAVGDRIVAVDAQPVAGLGVDAVRARLSQPPGTRVKLQVVRAKAARAVELELEEVL